MALAGCVMTVCAHLFDDTGLQCTREDHPQEPRGHVYHSTSDDLGDHGRHSDEGGQP